MEPLTTTDSLNATSRGVELRGLTVSFDQPDGTERTVLDNIDLTIEAGQFLALVGRSGCGKTTLLNTVAGLVDPTSGTVSVHGQAPRDARGDLGFMQARDALLPWRRALGNVEYGMEIRGMGKAERRERALEWLRAVHLEHAMHNWPWQLSQGMRQRVALARTWALDPSVLLMDEPFAALDAYTRISVQSEFLRLWQSGERSSVIFVTHDLHEAVALADRVILMGDGVIVDDVVVAVDRPRDLESVADQPGFHRCLDRLKRSLHNRPS